jgi:N5-(carboxyethyl)ornithine synthase
VNKVKRIGFPISHKENERRRGLLPPDVARMKNPGYCYFERGFGEPLGISDREYEEAGGRIAERGDILRMEVICNPKALDPDMTDFLREGQILFGWVHAVQKRKITDILTAKGMTGIAWGEMFKNGRHVFSRNNEIAGAGAIIHGACFSGRMPEEWKAALLGLGNCGRGAEHILKGFGAEVTIYHRDRIFDLRDELDRYNLIVNTMLWDELDDRLVLAAGDLGRMDRGSMIIDVSCDSEGICLETTHPTTVDDPVYTVEGVIHYAVDHVPTLFHRSASRSISKELPIYLDALVEGTENEVLEKATVIRDGKILDERIIRFQKRS